MYTLYNKILYIIKTEGVEGIFIRILRKIIIVEYTYLTNLSKINVTNNYSGLFFVELNSETLEEMFNEYSNEIGQKKFDVLKQNMKNPDIKIFTVIANKIKMGYYHLSSGDVYDSCTNFTIPKMEINVHLFDDYTFQDHRGNKAHSFSIYSRLNFAMKSGYKTATVNIMAGNLFSEKAYSKFDFFKIRKIIFINIFTIKRTFVKDYNFAL